MLHLVSKHFSFSQLARPVLDTGLQGTDTKLLDPENLISCNKLASPVGGSKRLCYGWLPTTFHINTHQINQPLYVFLQFFTVLSFS